MGCTRQSDRIIPLYQTPFIYSNTNNVPTTQSHASVAEETNVPIRASSEQPRSCRMEGDIEDSQPLCNLGLDPRRSVPLIAVCIIVGGPTRLHLLLCLELVPIQSLHRHQLVALRHSILRHLKCFVNGDIMRHSEPIITLAWYTMTVPSSDTVATKGYLL